MLENFYINTMWQEPVKSLKVIGHHENAAQSINIYHIKIQCDLLIEIPDNSEIRSPVCGGTQQPFLYERAPFTD